MPAGPTSGRSTSHESARASASTARRGAPERGRSAEPSSGAGCMRQSNAGCGKRWDAHGGRAQCVHRLRQCISARPKRRIDLARLLELAQVSERTWAEFTDTSEWVETEAVGAAPLEVVREGAEACMRWKASEGARALGLDIERSTEEIVAWTAHWKWPQVTPPLGIAALYDGAEPMRAAGAWAAALRLEQCPERMRARIEREGPSAARTFVTRAGKSEEAHLRANLERLAREWITTRWLARAKEETEQREQAARCAPERIRKWTMASAREARRALREAAQQLLHETRARWALEKALRQGWTRGARLTVRIGRRRGQGTRQAGHHFAQVGWLVAFDEPAPLLALCQLRGYARPSTMHMRSGAWVGIGATRSVKVMDGLGQASLESYAVSAGGGDATGGARQEAMKRVFRE